MKVALISFTPIAVGIRSISSYLRANNIETKLIFIPLTTAFIKSGILSDKKKIYNELLLSQLAELCDDSDIVGISLTNYEYDRANEITNYFKSTSQNKIVVWGGICPTVSPDSCLNSKADYIFRGEGELAFKEFLDKCQTGSDFLDVKGLGYRKNGDFVLNPPYPIVYDVDTLPWADHSFIEHYIYDPLINNFEYLTKEKYLNYCYRINIHGNDYFCYSILISRGCKLFCTYCSSNAFSRFYNTHKLFRPRSPMSAIKELKWVQENLNIFNGIFITDDNFLDVSVEYLQEFCKLYKEHNIKFVISTNISPQSITKEKFDLFVDVGLVEAAMGIQSCSGKTKKLFKRDFSNEFLLERSKILNDYKDKIKILYSIIIDNPFENDEDKIETIKGLNRLIKPFELAIYSLRIFEGTDLYVKAETDLKTADEKQKLAISRSMKRDYFILTKDYLSYVYVLTQLKLPNFVYSILTSRLLRMIFNNQFVNRLIPVDPLNFNRYVHNVRLLKNLIKRHKLHSGREIVRILRLKRQARKSTMNL